MQRTPPSQRRTGRHPRSGQTSAEASPERQDTTVVPDSEQDLSSVRETTKNVDLSTLTSKELERLFPGKSKGNMMSSTITVTTTTAPSGSSDPNTVMDAGGGAGPTPPQAPLTTGGLGSPTNRAAEIAAMMKMPQGESRGETESPPPSYDSTKPLSPAHAERVMWLIGLFVDAFVNRIDPKGARYKQIVKCIVETLEKYEEEYGVTIVETHFLNLDSTQDPVISAKRSQWLTTIKRAANENKGIPQLRAVFKSSQICQYFYYQAFPFFREEQASDRMARLTTNTPVTGARTGDSRRFDERPLEETTPSEGDSRRAPERIENPYVSQKWDPRRESPIDAEIAKQKEHTRRYYSREMIKLERREKAAFEQALGQLGDGLRDPPRSYTTQHALRDLRRLERAYESLRVAREAILTTLPSYLAEIDDYLDPFYAELTWAQDEFQYKYKFGSEGPDKSRELTCPYCASQGFETEAQLDDHVYQIHPLEREIEEGGQEGQIPFTPRTLVPPGPEARSQQDREKVPNTGMEGDLTWPQSDGYGVDASHFAAGSQPVTLHGPRATPLTSGQVHRSTPWGERINLHQNDPKSQREDGGRLQPMVSHSSRLVSFADGHTSGSAYHGTRPKTTYRQEDDQPRSRSRDSLLSTHSERDGRDDLRDRRGDRHYGYGADSRQSRPTHREPRQPYNRGTWDYRSSWAQQARSPHREYTQDPRGAHYGDDRYPGNRYGGGDGAGRPGGSYPRRDPPGGGDDPRRNPYGGGDPRWNPHGRGGDPGRDGGYGGPGDGRRPPGGPPGGGPPHPNGGGRMDDDASSVRTEASHHYMAHEISRIMLAAESQRTLLLAQTNFDSSKMCGVFHPKDSKEAANRRAYRMWSLSWETVHDRMVQLDLPLKLRYQTLMLHLAGRAALIAYDDHPNAGSYRAARSKLEETYFHQERAIRDYVDRLVNLPAMSDDSPQSIKDVAFEIDIIHKALRDRNPTAEEVLFLFFTELLKTKLNTVAHDRITKAFYKLKDKNATWGHTLTWDGSAHHVGWRQLLDEAYEVMVADEHANRGRKKKNKNENKGLSSNSTNGGNQNQSSGKKGGQNGAQGNSGGGDTSRFLPEKTGMPTHPSNGKLCPVPDCNTKLSESHMWVINCPRFKNLSNKQAYTFFKASKSTCRLCFSCQHVTNQCKLKLTCLAKLEKGNRKGQVCEGQHHTKMHWEGNKPNNTSNATSTTPPVGEAGGSNQD